jgi:hypothetical protein
LFHVFDRVGWFDVECDDAAGEGPDEYLHGESARPNC